MPEPKAAKKARVKGIHVLDAATVRTAKPQINDDGTPRATVLPDGGGLRLIVSANGLKHWQFRFTIAGKESTLQLGAYPDISLAEAREKAAEYRRRKKEGANPTQIKKLEVLKAKAGSEATFAVIWSELLTAKEKNNASPAFLKKARNSVAANLLPKLGTLPIAEITAPVLRVALEPMEARGALDLLTFVRRMAGEVFDLAKATARFSGDNPAHALKKNIFAKGQEEHRKALPWADMPAFLANLDTIAGRPETIIAERLLIQTATRPGELVAAEWPEFDLEAATWTIPAPRTKTRRLMHKIPLPAQTVAMLKELKEITGGGRYLFPAYHGSSIGHITTAGLLKTARKANSTIDNHGFRATFRTHAEESGLWRHEVMESALHHTKANAVVAAYDRATHFKERVKLAQWYADELEAAKKGYVL